MWSKFTILFSLCVLDTWASDLPVVDGPVAKTVIDEPTSKAAGSLAARPELSGVSNWPLVIVTLLGIVALILCLAWFAKRFGGFSATGNSKMRVVAAIPLGARERVALIDVNGQQFLLGVTAQNINHLHSFDEPVIDLDKTVKGEFAQKLHTLLGAQKTPGGAGD